MFNKSTLIHRNQRMISQKMGKEFIVLDLNAGNLYRLNRTGQSIWQGLSKPRKVKDLVEKIVEEYNVQQKIVEREVFDFIKEHLNTLFFITDADSNMDK